jgi:DNA-binding NtrC family response regulator
MKHYRCAVVCANGANQALATVLEAMAQSGDIQAEVCDQVTSTGSDFAAAVFVSDGMALENLLCQIRTWRCKTPFIALLVVITGNEDLDSLLRVGVCDFVAAPQVARELTARLRRAFGALTVDVRPSRRIHGQTQIRGLIYESEACEQVASKIPMMANCDANVLILGETGTGKEVCAQAIHYMSARAPNPWIAVNCGAIPTDLVESELFGHSKGAYTTAHASRVGLIHEAEKGTLFLDDIDCLPLLAQVKLLRFLQEREYRPIGSNTVQHSDVRVIAASNCELNDLVIRGTFRKDLYYRLNVLRLNLPALRNRLEDIPALAAHFVCEFTREFDRKAISLSPGALQKLCAHNWPGNVRELKHVIERAVLLSTGAILNAESLQIDGEFQAERRNNSFQSAKSRVVQKFERSYLEQVLVAHAGNVTQAAKAASKDRRAFFELMRKHHIEPQSYRTSP